MHRLRLLLLLGFLCKLLPAAAQEIVLVPVSFSFTDSIPLADLPVPDSLVPQAAASIQPKPVSLRSVLIPSAMIGYGAFAVGNRQLKKVNEAMQQAVWENRNNGEGRTLHLDNFTLLAPAAAVYALNFAGIKGKNNLVDRSFLYGLSNLIGSGITSSVKRLSGVMRPDSSNTLSFPSGHTSKAFIAAEFLRQEYKHRSPWYGIAGYAVAVGTGFMRMYNNKHWFNDVVAGAGVGILSTRISYWLYPKIKAALFPETKSHTMLFPAWQDGAVGVGLVHRF